MSLIKMKKNPTLQPLLFSNKPVPYPHTALYKQQFQATAFVTLPD